MCIILVGRHVRVLEETRDVGEAGAIVAKPGEEGENEEGSGMMVVGG
jgi:hypothetical protein